MSETEERRGILDRVKDAFWTSGDPPPEEAAAAEPEAAPAPAPTPEAAADSAGAADFTAAYAQIAGAGDPKTDQVLTAYADMSSQGMDAGSLATAMKSMIRAFGADARAISETLAQRMAAIASAVGAKREAKEARIAEMGARAASVVSAAENEIGELEERIKDLRGKVAEAQVSVRDAQASEQSAFTDFERQAARKTAELDALAQFLGGTAAA